MAIETRSQSVRQPLTDAQWQEYEEQGYLRLGRVLDDWELEVLQERIDGIMMGQVGLDYDRLLMQLDSTTGEYSDSPVQSRGFKGPTLAYRKIQDLEQDHRFFEFLELPLFKEICTRTYGEGVPIASYRAMFMNKPAKRGTLLPWHQDRWTSLDRDPLITVWTALDPATVENGCVQVVPGSHRHGIINPDHPSGFVTEEQARQYAPESETTYLELEAGEAVLLHNWLLHRSDVNRTDIPRRAFSVCYMDGRTNGGKGFMQLWDETQPGRPRNRFVSYPDEMEVLAPDDPPSSDPLST